MKQNRSGCPVEEVFVQLGGRWKMMILSFLLEKPRRFSEIKNNIPNISQRMLILELNFLENKGFIERSVYEGKPVKVEYSLTEEGQYLDRFILMCREYGEWIREREMMRDSFNHCL
ncbi:winged helix-turn-helix transcriptional regulator [Acinetobacter guillouiae]|uniref:winged helix-turn-helix transcriptional regulator n=1 Tax=Acinetobacter TaxID=469 RepID=UPI001FBACADE|nr:helix-turn-helix domain-containing protein [Acinetobacter sp. NyZ410]UOH19827.1 helix-turn-helix transcriptional regulator [Acinetobacter sp. NyZ410]